MEDDELKERGLKRLSKYACAFWNPITGWHVSLEDTKEDAIECRGYGDFVGMSEVICVVPEEAL